MGKLLLLSKRDTARFWSKVIFQLGDRCWMWNASLNSDKYGTFNIPGVGIEKAHVISWCFFNEKEIPDGLEVLHKCDRTQCVNPNHLYLGTQADNIRDMDERGRRITAPHFGSKNPMSKLTEAQVLEIRKLLETSTEPYEEIGKRYGVCAATIHHIDKRKSWTHI
jgi:hypothetical protein